MDSNLYEILGVTKDATTEQIRKAYKRKALKTHPDKLPPGLSEEDKRAAEEKFRQISHACEILTDTEKRREYDIHGVWPPPQPEGSAFDVFNNDVPGHQHGHRSHTFPGSFSTYHHHHAYPNFVFRDPFEFFESIFRDFEEAFRPPNQLFDPFGVFNSHHPRNLFSESIFSMPPMLPISAITLGPGPEHHSGPRGNFFSESVVTQTVNGVTQTIHTRRDQDGNEHVTRRCFDGTEVHTINGVEQSTRGYLPQNMSEPRQPLSSQSQARPQYRNTMPSHPQPRRTQSRRRDIHNSNTYNTNTQQPAHYTMQSSSNREYDILPPPYPGSNDPYRSYDQTPTPDRHGAPRRHRDRYVADGYSEPIYDMPWYGDHHRKKFRPSNRT